jgi:hypothetical protein
MTAVKLFHGTGVLGSIDALPFKDLAFDLVLITEVLEHLPTPVHEKALQEIKRVAARYVLITVPNTETLEACHIKCRRCGSIYHAWGHLRSFDKKSLQNMLSGFHLDTVRLIGPRIPVLFAWSYILLHYLGDTWGSDKLAICPDCGKSGDYNRDGNWFGTLWKRVVWRLYERTPLRKKAFLGALYRRESGNE